MTTAASGAQAGYSTTVGPAQYATPVTINQTNNGGPIRSVTIGNQSNYTTAYVYNSNRAGGLPLFTVLPGNYITAPIMSSAAVTIAFVANGGAFDGAMFVHTDVEPLAASGFTQGVTLPSNSIFNSVQSSAGSSASGYCPPLFQANGQIDSIGDKLVAGEILCNVLSGQQVAQVTVNFASTLFADAAYKVLVALDLSSGYVTPTGWNNAIIASCIGKTSSSVTLAVTCGNGAVTTGSGSYWLAYLLVGA